MNFTNECAKEELDFFSEPVTQFEIEGNNLIEYTPITSLDKNDKIHFRIIGQSDEYLRLKSSYIIVNLEIFKTKSTYTEAAKSDDLSFKEATEILPVNNLFHSMFSNVEVSLNNKKITSDHMNYAYRAYLQTLLNFPKEAQDSYLSTCLWRKDKAGEFDSMTANDGAIYRKGRFKLSTPPNYLNIQLAGRLFIDFFNQPLNLLNNINVDVILTRHDVAFPFMYAEDAYNYRIKNISLFVRKVKIDSNIQEQIDKRLLKEPAKYPFTRGEIKTFEINQNNRNVTYDNLYLGKLPKRLFIGFVDSNAYDGNKTKNPFNFKHYNINFLTLYKNGVQVPSQAYTPNFGEKQNMRSYISISETCNTFYREKSVNISADEYINGYTLWGFDLTPAHCDDEDFFHLAETGNIKLELKLPSRTGNVTCIIYADFDDILRIAYDRNVSIDYIL